MPTGEAPTDPLSPSAYRRARNTLCAYNAPLQTAQTGSRIIIEPFRVQGVCRSGVWESCRSGRLEAS